MKFSVLNEKQKIKLESAPNIFTALHSEYKWRKTRNGFVEEEQGVCQMCGWDKHLHVHHIVPWHENESLRYEKDNLVTLCKHCHFSFGHWLNWRGENPNIIELCVKTQMDWPVSIWKRALEHGTPLALLHDERPKHKHVI